MNLRVWRVEISDWSWVSRLRHGKGRAHAAARRAWPLRAAASSLAGCTMRRPAVWLWSLLKQLFPFSFRKKVVNWMKEFASNFG